MTLCEVSLLHIKFLHWTASSNLIIFLRLVKEIIYANAGSWSVTNKEVFNVNVVALQWPSTLRCKMRSSNWIVFSSLLWRWSFDEEDAIPPFLLDNLLLSTHSPCPYIWNTYERFLVKLFFKAWWIRLSWGKYHRYWSWSEIVFNIREGTNWGNQNGYIMLHIGRNREELSCYLVI